MTHGQNVAQLVAGSLYCSILDQFSHLIIEHARGLVRMLCEIGMVASVALDTNPLALLGHSKYESPPVLGIQVGICQDQQALVLFQDQILFQVLKYHASMKLLDTGIIPDSSVHYTFPFQLREVLFDMIQILRFSRSPLLCFILLVIVGHSLAFYPQN